MARSPRKPRLGDEPAPKRAKAKVPKPRQPSKAQLKAERELEAEIPVLDERDFLTTEYAATFPNTLAGRAALTKEREWAAKLRRELKDKEKAARRRAAKKKPSATLFRAGKPKRRRPSKS